MTDFAYKRKLRRPQNTREKIELESRLELQRATGDKEQELRAKWSSEFFMIQEEIEEWQSDHVREQAERLDIALPEREEGKFWERMHQTGDRLILTTRGREDTREKIRKERRQVREAWGFYLQMAVTIGSLFVAALAIYFRK